MALLLRFKRDDSLNNSRGIANTLNFMRTERIMPGDSDMHIPRLWISSVVTRQGCLFQLKLAS